MLKNKTEFDFISGEVVLIDKPLEWTSFDAVKKVRATITRRKGIRKIKVGHAGTLDPLATGLLILCTGKFTKKIQEYTGLDKEYTGTMKLGATTPSFDLETMEDQTYPTDHINERLIQKAITGFIGEIDQVPPMFSAIKHEGSRAYFFARNNEMVELKSRKVRILELEITRIEMPYVGFRVVCSKGTYIRSLVRDIGLAMHCGAYLTELRRTRIGDFSVEQAVTPAGFEEILSSVTS